MLDGVLEMEYSDRAQPGTCRSSNKPLLRYGGGNLLEGRLTDGTTHRQVLLQASFELRVNRIWFRPEHIQELAEKHRAAIATAISNISASVSSTARKC